MARVLGAGISGGMALKLVILLRFGWNGGSITAGGMIAEHLVDAAGQQLENTHATAPPQSK
ncbi:hypothetical protein [Pelobacter propionicus]|uniref:hypothetical protein n=1 Tax=Pelobacter propionicus TaxID=29543 RepID=UPI0012EEA71F|nr:hypothetical protein [Pelobacter propionicus]